LIEACAMVRVSFCPPLRTREEHCSESRWSKQVRELQAMQRQERREALAVLSHGQQEALHGYLLQLREEKFAGHEAPRSRPPLQPPRPPTPPPNLIGVGRAGGRAQLLGPSEHKAVARDAQVRSPLCADAERGGEQPASDTWPGKEKPLEVQESNAHLTHSVSPAISRQCLRQAQPEGRVDAIRRHMQSKVRKALPRCHYPANLASRYRHDYVDYCLNEEQLAICRSGGLPADWHLRAGWSIA